MASWSSWLTDQVADATGVDVSGVVAGVSGVGEQLTGALASVSGDLQEFVDTVQVSRKREGEERREKWNAGRILIYICSRTTSFYAGSFHCC